MADEKRVPSKEDIPPPPQPEVPVAGHSPTGGDNRKVEAKPPEREPKAETETGAGTSITLLLVEPTGATFGNYDLAELKALYEQLEVDYNAVLDEFLNSANSYVLEFKKYRRKQRRWRVIMLVVTAGLAVLNIVAAQHLEGHLSFFWWKLETVGFFSLLAAIYAAVLALLSNIESFLNYSDAKASSRLSRELFLDAYREHRMLWYSYVRPFGYRVQACYNANILLRKIVTRDSEIRRKVKEADRETVAPSK